ncbi:hypothetical protein DFR71_3280 [Nocardia alba]|uniref:Capsular polysaccharide biosynthesis protein n=1 Tax=Nocardia alba TaxID=225051 RepID=A0A4R1FUB0_9NOCA|nr:hypothetical protein DFR71_3280 [Nocardia alba]
MLEWGSVSSTESPSTADLDSGGRSMPTVNIAGHLRQLIRVLPFALVAALVVGGVVWFVRDGSERTYQASITVQISQPSIGAVFNELTQPYIVMVSDTRVLSDVVKNGLAPSEADLRSRVSAMTGPAPSLLIITAEAGSPEQASKLVVAVGQSLDSVGSQMRTEAIARSAADLEAHRRAVEDTFSKRLSDDPLRPELSFDARDVARETEFRQVLGPARLTVLTTPSWELVAPHPLQEGLFAALATLIVVAEGLVLAGVARSRRRGNQKPAETTSVEADQVPPAVDTRVPATDPRPPAVDPHFSATQIRVPATDPRPPAVDTRSSAAQNRAPGADPRTPATQNRAPGADPRPSAADPRSAATQTRVPATDPRPPATQNRVPRADPRPPTTDPRPPADQTRVPATETETHPPETDSRVPMAETPPAPSFDKQPRRAAPVASRSSTVSHDPETMALPRVRFTPDSPRPTTPESHES